MAEISSEAEKDSKDHHASVLDEARSRFKLCEDAYSENRRLFIDDLKFSAGEQWDASQKSTRESDGRPCLVVNKLNQSINQVTNDQRQNRPSIKVHPVDDGGDIEVAKIQQGLIRNIEQISSADAAYDTAFEYTARGGEGYWRVVTEFSSPTSFDLDLKIKRVRDQLSVYIDPNSVEPDGSDSTYGFIFERVSKDEYKRLYPNSELSGESAMEWSSYDAQAPGWLTKDTCIVAEYFTKTYEDKPIVLLSTGEVVAKADLTLELQKRALQGIQAVPVQERVAQVPKITWYKLNGVEILAETRFPGIYIPIIPCYGAELVIDGKVIRKGITRDAKDPQRMLNFWASAEAEAIATAPRSPYIGYEGQFEGYEQEWASANRRNHAFLQVKPITVGGTAAPLPQRQTFEPAIQAITQARMLASDDLKATTGIYDAGLGAKSNETSGVAIARRASQGQTANFHLIDNLSRSIKHTGRILIWAIPEVYDSARAARIIGEEGEEKIVKINQPIIENGKEVIYSFEAGKYDVTVNVGPSFQTKRQEAAASMLDLSKANAQVMQLAGDLIVKNMDWPGAQEIADRLKKALPPGIAEDDKNKQPIPPEAQAQMQQMGQMVDQLTAELKAAQEKIEKNLLELESKERIEMAKLETQLEIERAKIDAKDSMALLNAQVSQIEARLSQLNYAQPISEVSEPELGGGMTAMPAEAQPQPTGGFSPGQQLEEESFE